jgi:hypothetical protein
VFLILFLSNCSDPFQGQPHLPDAQLIANFQAHKEGFERLRQMIIEDKGLTRVDDNWTAPGDPKAIGVSPERIAEYRKLFSQLGIPRGFSATSERDRIEFLASSQGWVAHGSHKCYLYASNPPKDLIGSLDHISSKNRSVGEGTRQIEGNWYLHFYGD